MTTVRCKFKVESITRTLNHSYPHKTNNGSTDYNRPEEVELWTVRMFPVYGNSDPNHENTKFWEATPSGSFELGTVNKKAVEQLRLGGEVYVDLTPCDPFDGT
jgi:hypothetical protein